MLVPSVLILCWLSLLCCTRNSYGKQVRFLTFLRFVTPTFFSDKCFSSHLGMNGRRAVCKYCRFGSRSSAVDCNFFFVISLLLLCDLQDKKGFAFEFSILLHTHIHLHLKFDNLCSSVNNLQFSYEICYSKNFELLQNKYLSRSLSMIDS